MKKLLALTYGVFCYLFFLATFLYLVGFLGDLRVPKSIDSGVAVSSLLATIGNLCLVTLFGIQHSIMARPAFKCWWTRFVPRAVERSTFVMTTCLVFLAMFLFWQPVEGTLWSVENATGKTLLWSLFAAGWVIVLIATFLIDHFHLFGLRQVWFHNNAEKGEKAVFRTPFLYKFVRHPMMTGMILAIWATPHMTFSHLIFSLGMTLNIVIGTRFEERDLVGEFGDTYRAYRNETPMLFPIPANTRTNRATRTVKVRIV